MKWSARSVSSVRARADAMALARGYAAMYGHDYVVVRIASEGVFDVEPRQSLDEVGAFGIVGIATPPDH